MNFDFEKTEKDSPKYRDQINLFNKNLNSFQKWLENFIKSTENYLEIFERILFNKSC